MQKKKNSGFTLLELLIALAILAIIAAIIIPNFFATTDRARLRSDIASARVIQNAMELYHAERGENLRDLGITEILNRLNAADFVDVDIDDTQSEGATWDWCSVENHVVVDIRLSPAGVRSAFESLPTAEQAFVRTGAAGVPD